MNSTNTLFFGLLFLIVPVINIFRSFRSSKAVGITVLVLVTALSGLLQICTSLLILIGAGAGNATGLWEIFLYLSASGLFLVGISILIWFIGARFRKPAEDIVNKPPNTGLS